MGQVGASTMNLDPGSSVSPQPEIAILVEPALAAIDPAPGPVAGVGLPALALVGGAYWLGRKVFGRKK